MERAETRSPQPFAQVPATAGALRRATPWLLLAMAALALSLGISEMWLYGHHGWTGSRRGIAGINYDRYGFVATRFGPVENYGTVAPERWEYYWHHPVMVHVLVGVAFKVFGTHEWAARLVPIVFSLLTALMLYLLALRWWGRAGAVATIVVFTFMPLSAFYGKFVNHEPLVLFLGVALTFLRVRFEETRAWRFVGAAAGLTLLGAFSDWPFFLVLGAYGVIELGIQMARWRHDRDLRFLVAVTLAGVAGLALVGWYLVSLQGGAGGGFKQLFVDRSGATDGSSSGLKALWERRDWYWSLFGPFATAGAAMWLLALPFRTLRRRLTGADALVGGSLMAGGGWMLLFSQGAYIHEYWCFYLTPFLVGATAWSFRAVWRGLRRIRPWLGGAGLTVLLVAFAGLGGARILEYQQNPSDVAREAPEYRFRFGAVAEWVAARTEPDDRILLQNDFPLRFQTGFYLDRPVSRARLEKGFRGLHGRNEARYLLLDRQRLPQSERTDILRTLAADYPVTFLDRFCVVDLAAEAGKATGIKALRIALHPPSALWSWFVSLVYPPYTIEPSDADAFMWALTLGRDAEARRLAARVAVPQDPPPEEPYARQRWLADAIAYHNAQRLLGRDTTDAFGRVASAVRTVGEMRIGDRATVIGVDTHPYQGGRLGVALVLRAERDGDTYLRPWMHRRPLQDASLPLPLLGFGGSEQVWHDFEPLPDAWREGMLYSDLFAFPDEPYPQEIAFFLDQKSGKEERELRPVGPARGLAYAGEIVLDRGTGGQRYDWVETAAPDCVPQATGPVARVSKSCLAALRPALDLDADIVLRGDDTLRFHGLRQVGNERGKAVLHALFSSDDPVRHDHRVRLLLAPAAAPPPVSRRGASAPQGDVKTSRWEPDDLWFLTFRARGGTGPRQVWLSAYRDEYHRGGRLPVTGSPQRDAVVLPVGRAR